MNACHNLNSSNGRFSFAYNKKNGDPWHMLGQSVNGAMTAAQAIELANMTWSVEKKQLKHPELNTLIDSYGIFRSDNNAFLGNVGSVYTPIQNVQAFEFVDGLLEAESQANYDTAGVLGAGETIFINVSLPYQISPDRAPDDITKTNLAFITSHDGSMSATAKLGTVRVVCNNTVQIALNQRGMATLRVKHSASGHRKLEEGKKLFTGVKQSVETMKEKLNFLANKRITNVEINDTMNRLFGDDWKDSAVKRNQIERISRIFESNDRNAFPTVRGSAYNLFQACTDWSDHERTVRQTAGKAGMSNRELLAESALFGSGDEFKTDALEIVLEAAKNAPDMPMIPQTFAMPQTTFKAPEAPKVNQNAVDSILSQMSY